MTVLLPAWLQAGEYNAEIDRSVPTGLIAPSGSLAARSGVRRWAGDELQVVATSPAAMSVIVRAGRAFVSGQISGTQGTYAVTNDEDVTLAITASSSLPRIDLVVLEVLDEAYSGTSNLARLRVVTGTPASTPLVPSVTGNFLILGQVAVGANVTSIAGTAITDRRQFLAAVGGVIPTQNPESRATLTNLPFGSQVWEASTNRVYLWRTDSSWEYLYGGTPPTISLNLSYGWFMWNTKGGGPWSDLRATKVSGMVHVTGMIGNEFAFTTPGQMFKLPAGYIPERRIVGRLGTGRGNMVRYDIMTDGGVDAYPGDDNYQHYAHDWWCIDLHFFVNNNTIG